MEKSILSKQAPEKKLLVSLKRWAGRNSSGKITVRHRGAGVKRLYRVVDFGQDKLGIKAKIISLEYDPYRSAFIALVEYPDKDRKDIFVGEGTTIQEGAVIIGPAIIGKNCVIGHCSLIRENCILGDNVHIGHAVEIKNSVFLNSAIAAHLNYIGDSLIGKNANISGGAILANFRLDKKTIAIRNGIEKIDTGLQKFGSIVGDGSSIGVNTVLNPGTILGKKTVVYPLTSVTGVHQDGEVIK